MSARVCRVVDVMPTNAVCMCGVSCRPVAVVAAEAFILVLCVVDIVLNWRAYGHRLYMGDKKWQTSFLVITALCWCEWPCSMTMDTTV